MNTTTIRIIIVTAIVVVLVISGVLLFTATQTSEDVKVNNEQHADINPGVIAGRWQRTDGGYIIEIRSAYNDGTLAAAYFNPNPINVSLASWSLLDNQLNIYVEMSDVNYPGSYYKLIYFPDQDQLAGTYYQALYQQTYDVQFVRMSSD